MVLNLADHPRGDEHTLRVELIDRREKDWRPDDSIDRTCVQDGRRVRREPAGQNTPPEPRFPVVPPGLGFARV